MKFNFKKKYCHEFIYNSGFKKYTEIQEKVIPILLQNKNLIGVSQTGSGKTFAFLLPIFDKLDVHENHIQFAIVVPTRELARQIYSEIQKFKEYEPNLTCVSIIGGESSDKKINDLNNKQPHIIVTTSEKFLEIQSKYRNIFNKLKTIVFDEADMLIDLGFLNSFVNILNVIPETTQRVAFSATLHDMLANKIRLMFKNCQIIDVSENVWKNEKIKHYLIHYSTNKFQVLKKIISTINPYFCIIFANTKKEVEEISEFLKENKVLHRMLHGDMEARKRKNIFNEIKNNNFQYLVSTDIASRGLDIDGASDIISWDLPKDDVWYVHRAGRAGRGKYNGKSYVFFDEKSLKQVTRLKNKNINWINLKYKNGELLEFDYKFRTPKPRTKDTEVDLQIRNVIQTSSKKVKPNYKKKMAIKIKKIKQKEKRKKIDANMKAALIKKYKMENAAKTRAKEGKKN